MKDRPVVVVGRGLGSIVGAHGRVRVERGGLYPDGGDAEPPGGRAASYVVVVGGRNEAEG